MPALTDLPGASVEKPLTELPEKPLSSLPGASPSGPVPATIGSYKSRFDETIEKAAKNYNVDPNIVRALHYNEERTDQDALVNPTSDAEGPMQMEPDTFKAYARPGAKISDPVENIYAGTNYMKSLLKTYKGDYHKAFAAYNLGHYDPTDTDSNMYASRAVANLKYLQSEVQTREPKKVFQAQAKTAAKIAKAVPAVDMPTDHLAMIRDAAGTVGKAEEKGAEAVGSAGTNVKNFVGENVWKGLGPDEQHKLVELQHSSASKAVLGSVGYLGQVLALVPSALDADLRENQGPGTENSSSPFREAFMKALKDPKHSEELLAQINSQYQPFVGGDTVFWAQRPGLADALAQISHESPSMRTPAEIAAGLYADTSRFLMDKPALRDIAAFAVGWFNPANRIPGAFLSPIGKVAGAGVGKVADKFPGSKELYTEVVTKGPMGDRFYKTQVRAENEALQRGVSKKGAKLIGEQTAAEHYQSVLHQSAAPHAVAAIFTQANKLGGLKTDDLKQLWKYHEKFNNDSRTSHIYQPGGGDTATVDPVTKALTMTVGGLHGVPYEEHLEHKFVYHPTLQGNPATGQAPQARKIILGMPGVFASPKDLNAYRKAMTKEDFKAALMAHPTITPDDADEFMAAAAQKTAKMNEKDKLAYMKHAVQMRVIGEEARNIGHPIQLNTRVPGQKNLIVFGTEMKTVERDHGMPKGAAGTSTMDERSFYTAEAVHEIDSTLRHIAPKAAEAQIPGTWSRAGTATSPGAFEGEQTLKEWLSTHLTAEKSKQGVAGSGLPIGGTKRIYQSLAEAYEGGMKDNPKFDPSIPLISQMTRSARLVNYIGPMLQHLKQVNYADLSIGILRGTAPEIEEGAEDLEDESAEGAKQVPSGDQFEPPLRYKFRSGRGAAGFDEMMSAAAKQGRNDAELHMGQEAWSAMDPKAQDEMATREAGKILKDIQDRFERKNPGMVWNLHEASALEDFKGFTMPAHILDAQMDAHPTFHTGGRDQMTLMGGAERPENAFENGTEMLSNLLRTSFLSTLPYHPVKNIAWLAFRYGHLTPVEIMQGLVAPHTIPQDLHDEIEEMGLSSTRKGQMMSPLAEAKYRIAADPAYAKPGRNQYANVAKTIPRTKAMLDSFRRTYQGPNLQTGIHWLGNAYYHGSKWAQDTVFALGEDAFTALTYKKFKDKGFSKEIAARKTRELFGDHANLTETERSAGLGRLLWFFNWFKTQMRLGAANAYSPRGIAGAQATNDALNSQNSNDPNNGDPSGSTKFGQMTAGGKSFGVAPPTVAYDTLFRNIGLAFTNSGQSFQDFQDFVVRSDITKFVPELKPFIEQVPKTMALGAEQPQIPLEQSVIFGNETKAILASFSPQVTSAITESAKDPSRILSTMGIPVTTYDSGARSYAVQGIVRMWKKAGFETMYYQAKTEQEKQNAITTFHKAIKPYEDMLNKAQGK